MAAESKTGFPYKDTWASSLNRRAISFPSGAINSTLVMTPMENFYGVNGSAGFAYYGNSRIISTNPMINQAGNPSGSALLDSVPVLKHDTGLVVDWSVQEQYKLEEGLLKYADETNIMKYIKIAATLPDKTVRDVALRCRWMRRKRRKQDEHGGKMVNGRKDKLVESSSKTNMYSTLPSHVAPYSPIMHHTDHNEILACEGISCASKQLLAQNTQAFSQIAANLSAHKLQDNINLFFSARDNINATLNECGDVVCLSHIDFDRSEREVNTIHCSKHGNKEGLNCCSMSEMPGIMRHMPPLPVSINEDLVNSMLSYKN